MYMLEGKAMPIMSGVIAAVLCVIRYRQERRARNHAPDRPEGMMRVHVRSTNG